MDDFEARAYPDTFTVGGQNLKGSRDRKTSEVHVPYTDEPRVCIGDVIQQRSGQSVIELKVLDVDFV